MLALTLFSMVSETSSKIEGKFDFGETLKLFESIDF